jgi:hypothetical protein
MGSVRAEDTRTVRLAARATGEPETELHRRLAAASVNVTIDTATPGALRTAQVLIATLLRGPGRVTVDPAGLPSVAREQLMRVAQTIRPGGALFAPAAAGSVTVAVGSGCAQIVVVPDTHGARLTCGRAREQRRAPSMLGVVLAAALAAGEIFKLTARVSPERCQLLEDLSFCPVTLTGEPSAAAPAPDGWKPTLTLAGLGAVGTAHALILSRLSTSGHALLIDRERYAPENLGTYTLGGLEDLASATRKVDLAARALTPGWNLELHHGELATALERIDRGDLHWTPLVLAGLDNHEGRREAQLLQPERILDAGTADTVLGLRDGRPGGPCLRCLLGAPPARRDPIAALTALGIPSGLARAPGQAVVDEHLLASAPDARARAILDANRGTPICGLARAAGLTELSADDYMPSVPFVSQQAACLSAGRLLALATCPHADLPNFFQYDALIGPDRYIAQWRPPDPQCACQQRSAVIAQVIRERREWTRT